MRIKRNNILRALACGLLLAGLTACSELSIDDLYNGKLNGKSQIVLTFVTPNDNASTRADGMGTRSADGDPDGYEAGIGYEDYINIAENDYKIYFFTYAEGDEKGGTLIAEFKPESITSTSTTSTTTYTVTGEVPKELMSVSNFRVVMLANWGWWYPRVEEGVTTIDDLCEGSNATFYADRKFVIDSDNLIPFYGVQEYSNVSFAEGTTTTLSPSLSLLRAVAKVELILTEGSDYDAFETVEIVNYNSQGYKAPWQVYTAEDYDTEMKKNPNTSDWHDEWVDGLHLVGGSNDSASKTQALTQITDATQDTWRIYLPEYNNMSTDYSYLTLTIGDEPYEIYFAEYTDGTTTAYGSEEAEGMPDRLNLKRNNLYRYYVTLKNRDLRVFVETWENVFDNEWTFGVTEPEAVGETFLSSNIMYKVLTSTVDDPTAELTVCTTIGSTFTSEVEIPSTVRHNGFTYTVTEIGDKTFDGKMVITKIILPETIEAIGSQAFNGCLYLEELYIYSYTPPTYQEDTFEGLTLSNVTLYVPYEVKDDEAHYNQEPWTSFKSIKVIPGTEPETNP